MRLTQWTDYSLRMLMYCAIHQERPKVPTVGEISEAHGISRSHLTKIAMTLAGAGLLETTRGRGGGLRLLKPADQIRVGDVVRMTETDFNLVECFDMSSNSCNIVGSCRLKNVLSDAMAAYLAVLDGATLADLISPAKPKPEFQLVPLSSRTAGRSVAKLDTETQTPLRSGQPRTRNRPSSTTRPSSSRQ